MRFIYSKAIPDSSTYDVIVVGSGSAGATAAIAASRNGARTLLLERLPFLGGTSTAVLDTFYGFYTPGETPRKVVAGISDDVIRGLQSYSSWIERPNTHGAGIGVTYHPEYLKVVWETLVRAAGVEVLLNACVQDVIVKDGRVESLIVATKAGLRRFQSHFVLDASGDADICHFAGIGYELAGEIEPAQTLTTTFKLVNVDIKRRSSISKSEFHALMAAAAESGRYQLPRREGSDHITPVDHMTATILTRLPSFEKHGDSVVNATDPELLSAAEMDGRLQAIEYIRFLRDCVPGYERAQLASFGVHIGVRETRRVFGDYRLTRNDVLTAAQFDDQIGLCGAPIEDHREGTGTIWHYLPLGECVGIPFRTLIPRDGLNVLVAGRCFSATHDAHASVRSMAQCMAMGQAAGTAAALAVKKRCTPRELDLKMLQESLRAQGALLEMK
ncbi:MAG: FAD-dependent oxidoreductase [Terracidiphilus sp.]|nr:FAD-dependent oxidoreductase [Terracidiphilus sp.]